MTDQVSDISVIVLVHNAAGTVERTLDSIYAQTVKCREIVVVDDGSTDGSGEVISRWQNAHPHVTVIKKTHEVCTGIATAATDGVEMCSGEWLMRCDADDTLPHNAFELLINEAERTGADVVWGAMEVTDGRSVKLLQPVEGCADLNDAPVDTVTFSLCNKIIRRRLITDNGIYQFPGVACWEDLGVVSRILALKPKTAFITQAVYTYYVEPGKRSLSRSSRDKILKDHIKIAVSLEKWFDEHGLTGEYGEWLERLKFCAKVKLLRGKGKNVALWKNTFPEVNQNILGIKHIKFAYRLMFATVAILPVCVTQKVADFCDRFYK